MKKNLMKWLLPAMVLFASCKKDDEVTTPAPVLQPAKGVYVLSEGSFGQNDTKLAYRDAATGIVSADFFQQQNPSAGGLGDTGNDMIIYGGKMYIVMNGSGNVTVLNAATATLISRISFGGTTANRNPRFALGTRGKVFVTCWDNSVSVIDTTSLAITTSIPVTGVNPEGLATTGNYLYVANSGALNFPDYDTTLSVIDLNSMSEIKKLKVGLNPQKVEINSAGDVYVSAYGDAFGTPVVPASITVISSVTNTVKTTLGSDYQYDHIRIFNDTAYLYNNYGGNEVKVYNTLTNTLVRNNFVTDGTAFTTSYGVNIDEENGDVYIMDPGPFSPPTPGNVTCFGRNGVKKFSFSVAALNPNKVLFLR